MSRTKRILLTLICVGALLAACGNDDNGNGDGDGEAATGFSGGNFTVTVESVDDGCFDGAMNTIVLPDGEANDLPAPVSFPDYDDLPTQVDIEFNEPFQDTEGIEFEAAGDNGLRTAGDGFTQTGVDIAAADGDDCLADMLVTAELSATDDDTFTGTGTLTITSAEGDDCPAFEAGPPCEVTTPMTATRN